MSDKADRGGSARARGGDHRLAVPAGQRLGDYRIERVLGISPFGITYLALDAQNRRVVIKEYLPSDIVTREGTALRGETAADDDLLRRGRERFLSEGKRLQRVKHASIVRAHNAFEANNTGYLVFEHESGETLADVLTGAHTLADEPLLRRFAFTLLEALEAVHEVSFLHGKVEPSNILLRSDGTPVLLDFGNARAATGLTRRASIALVPGYAAIEQYTSHEAQGPWTDLYGLAAVLYRVVSGKDPLDAPARLLEDRLLPAAQAGSGRFSRTFLSGIDAALVVRPEDRPQTVAEWRPMLDRPLAPKAQAARDPENADDDEDDYVPGFAPPQERSRTWIYATAGVASVLVLGTLALGGIGYMANNANDPRRSAANNYPEVPSADLATVPPRNQVMPLPPVEDAAAREARMREDERRVAEQIAAGRAAEEQRAREAARQREQERQTAEARRSDEQKRAAQQQEQARQQQARQEQVRQEQARQEQARQEQERQAAAARAAEEARQREAAARQEQARQEAARQEQARQEQARQEAARQEQARQEAARQQAARAEQERQAAARAAEEAQQRAVAQQQEQARQQEERQAAATRLAEELRQRDLIRQQEQAAAARTLEEARVREQARAPAEAPRAATTTGSAMLLPPPPAPAVSAPSSAVGSSAVPLTGPVTLTPPSQATPQPAPSQQVARATAPPLVQPPAPRPDPVVATPAPVARAVDVGRIDAVNWQWGYVVMQMEQRQGMQVGDRVYARSGDTKLWMTVRRVNGTQVSAVPDSDLQRYSVNGRVYKE